MTSRNKPLEQLKQAIRKETRGLIQPLSHSKTQMVPLWKYFKTIKIRDEMINKFGKEKIYQFIEA
jgi:hypothetical protein